VSPDSVETRIQRLEQKVARLEQRVEDLLVSVKDQIGDLDRDIRSFAPIVKEVNDLTHNLERAATDAREARAELGQLRKTLTERQEVQRLERKSDRRWLVGTVLSSAALIVGAIQVLGGFG
jgi:chromosome segregation ATPase